MGKVNTISIEYGDKKEINLTMDEAEDLYNILSGLFDKSLPRLPNPEPLPPDPEPYISSPWTGSPTYGPPYDFKKVTICESR